MIHPRPIKTIFALLFLLLPIASPAQVMKRSSCAVPLDEKKSAPAIDLLSAEGTPIDRDTVIDLIKSGADTSLLEPQLSDFYVKNPLPPVGYNVNFPSDADAVSKPFRFVTYAEVDHLTQARVVDPHNGNAAYNLTVTYDVNAAVARNALLRKLGYDIPSPKLYRKLSVTFPDQETREDFLVTIAKIRDIGLWVDGGIEEVNKKNLTVTLIDVALESALIVNLPPMHWGIFKPETIQSRRPFRALLVPLTLLDIDESVNMYSFEPAKIENSNLVFSRVYANSFRNETSLGDVRWIARKIAKLTRADWVSIIRAGNYPVDIETLIVEKTIARTNQLMALLRLDGYTPQPYNPYVTSGNVINGKAYQSHYDGYPHFFAYGDPLNPLRPSEVARYFGIELISNAIKFATDQANRYLQIWSPDQYVKKHTEKFQNDILNHLQNHPNEPYIQKVSAWGGPIAGGGVTANRSVVAGTYYGSSSPVQMVDSISVNARIGAFIGLSGVKSLGVSFSPTLAYNRSYVHVRPIDDIKSAIRNNWANLAVPFTMLKLSNVLSKSADTSQCALTPKPTETNPHPVPPSEAEIKKCQASADETQQNQNIDDFLSEMKVGEMFIVIDGFTVGNNTMVGIPLGGLLGLLPPFNGISETININNQYAITGRTTFYKSEKGIQVYLSGIHQQTHQVTADTNFFLKIFTADFSKMNGNAKTSAYIFPSEFTDDADKQNFRNGVRRLLRRNNSDIIEQNFKPYELKHDSDGRRRKFRVGPWQWVRRETVHRLDITPPVDTEGRYDPSQYVRTVMQGQINRISGTDFYGFFGSILTYFYSFLSVGGGAKGDDPASNFLGKSKSTMVSTEMETTEARPNNTLVRVQQTYAGWTMRKKKLMKLLDAIGKKLENFNPNGGLIDHDSFTQTKRVQAYNVIWSLSIYEPGVDKLLDVLDTHKYDTRTATWFMADLMGRDVYRKYCADRGLPVGFSQGPVSIDDVRDKRDLTFETANAQTTLIGCATPWMKDVFDIRGELERHREIFAKDVHDEDIAQDKIHWLNKSVMKLERSLDLALLIKWIGTDNSYFQVTVAGYRKGDERAQDEEGRSSYFSNSVGSINTQTRNGPLDEIGRTSEITQHELTARYLSDGF